MFNSDVRICLLLANDILTDARVRKEAVTLAHAGASVTVVEQSVISSELAGEEFSTVTVAPVPQVKTPKLGYPNVWWPVRVATNLTVTKYRSWRIRRITKGFGQIFYNQAMVDAAIKLRPTIVQANDVYTLLAALEVSKETGAKLVYDSHELFAGYFDSERIQNDSDTIEAVCIPRASAVYTAAPGFAAALKERWGLDEVEVILNSMPCETINPQPVHYPIRILEQCGLRRISDNHLMIEAMQHLRDIATLTIQGRCKDQSYLEEMTDLIEKLDLRDVVTMTGQYEAFEAVSIAQDFDIGVAVYKPRTKSKEYALSNRVFTYLNAGLAVAATDTYAHRTLDNFQEYGIFVDVTDASTIAKSIRPLLEDSEKITKMKYAAYRHAQDFSWNQQEKKLIALYEKVLNN